MASIHLVNDFQFEVAFPSESEAFEHHSRIGSFASQRLLAVAEEVLRELDPSDAVLRIDALEIDLGRIPRQEYYQKAEQRFREQLKAQLRDKLERLRGNPGPASLGLGNVGPGKEEPRLDPDRPFPDQTNPDQIAGRDRATDAEALVPAADNELDLVVWSLEYGYLPWNARYLADGELAAMVRRVIERDGFRLAARLRRSQRAPEVARRLAWQAPKDLLEALAKLLRTGLQPGQSPGTAVPSVPTAWNTEAWNTLLLELLDNEPDTRPNPRQEEPAPGEPQPDAWNLSPHWPEAQEWLKTLALLETSALETSGLETALETALETSALETAWRETLDTAIATGDARLLASLGEALFAENAAVFQAALYRLGAAKQARQAMAAGFPALLLGRIVRLLEPGEADFVEEVIEHPHLFREAADRRNHTPEETKAHLWELTLTYLLVERGSRFNRRAFLESTVRGMAAHCNARYKDLLESLGNLVGRIQAKTPMQTEMLELLAALSQDLSATPTREPGSSPGTGAETGTGTATGTGLQAGYSPVAETMPERAPLLEKSPLPEDGSEAAPWLSTTVDLVSAIPRAAEDLEEELHRKTGRPGIGKLLRGFTRKYLEEERGDPLNQHGYVASLVRQAAEHWKLDRKTLLEAISDTIGKMELPVDLASGLTPVLHRLQNPWTTPLDASTLDGDKRLSITLLDILDSLELERQRASSASQSGASSLLGHPTQPPEFVAALLAAAETVARQLRHLPGFRGLDKLLTDFSRNFLDEAGGRQESRFSKHLYLADLIRRAAQHYRLDRKSLPIAISATLRDIELPGGLATELTSILRDLRLPWPHILEAALLFGDMLLLRRIAADERARGAMIDHLPLPVLRDLAQMAEPSAASLMRQLAEQPTLFHQALPKENPAAIRHSLWEFTFAYAMVDRGSSFNRISYATSMIHQLAAHHNLRDEDLLASLSQVVERAGLQGQAHAELASVLSSLRGASLHRSPSPESTLGGANSHGRALPERTHAPEEARLAAIPERQAASSQASLREVLNRLLAEADDSASTRLNPDRIPQSEIPPAEVQAIQASLRQWLAALEPEPSSRMESSQTDRFQIERSEADAAVMSRIDRAGDGPSDSAGDQPSKRFLHSLRELLADPLFARDLIERLPERQMATLLSLLWRIHDAPRGFAGDQAGADRLAALAARISEAAGISKPALKWQFLVAVLVQQRHAIPPTGHPSSGHPISDLAFARRFLAWLAPKAGARDAGSLAWFAARRLRMATAAHGAGNDGAERARVADLLEQVARTSAKQTGGAELARTAEAPQAGQAPRKPIASKPRPPRKSSPIDFSTQQIAILNAGLVLVGPYVPRLFAMTGLLEEKKFLDSQASFRGISLLQYLVDGSLDPAEHLLPLNKILCGLAPDEPIQREVQLADAEKEAGDGLLQAILAHWSILGNTSVQGLRESFLQREGRLSYIKDAWQLRVEPRAFDMLLDKLPWSFKVVKYPWMRAALYVEWR